MRVKQPVIEAHAGRFTPVSGGEPAWTRPVRAVLARLATRSMRAIAARRATAAASPAVGAHLHGVADTFLVGYRAALDGGTIDEIAARLDAVAAANRGFAYEGAAMALALLDRLLPRSAKRFDRFVGGPADAHVYMAHVGAGWASARLHRSARSVRRGLDPLLGWLAVDGYGFHQGYFHPEIYVAGGVVPRGVAGATARVFDQGLGRSLWFVEGADVDSIAFTIDTFSPSRRADLWSGVVLAAAYAGGVSVPDLRALKSRSAAYASHVAQASAFAAEARDRAGNPTPHTEAACHIFCGIGAREAAALARQLAPHAVQPGDVTSYEEWRRRVGAAVLASAGVLASAEPRRQVTRW